MGSFKFLILSLVIPVITTAQTDWTQFSRTEEVRATADDGTYVWAVTDKGLVQLDKADTSIVLYNTSNSDISDINLRSLVPDGNGGLWIGTDEHGIDFFDGTDFTNYPAAGASPFFNAVEALAIDNNGDLWVGEGFNLYQFDGVAWTPHVLANGGYVRDIKLTSNGDIWIATGASGNGVYHWDGATMENLNTTNSSLPSNDVHDLHIDASDVIRMATSLGLAIYDGTNWTIMSLNNPGGFPGNWVTQVAVDGNGILWLDFISTGLYKYNGTLFQEFNSTNSGLKDNTIHSIELDDNGLLWIGSGSQQVSFGGLNTFDGVNANSWETIKVSNSEIPGNSIHDIAGNINQGGDFWMATPHGVGRWDGSNWTVYNTANSGLPNNWVADLFYQEPDHLWMATNNGLVDFNSKSGVWGVYTNQNTSGGLPVDFVNAVTVNANGNVWAATVNGLSFWDRTGNIWTTYTMPDLPNNNMTILDIGPDGKVWAGSWLGVSAFDGSGWTTYNAASTAGFPADDITAIYAADWGTLVGTFTNGMGYYNPTTATWQTFNNANSPLLTGIVRSISGSTDQQKSVSGYDAFLGDEIGNFFGFKAATAEIKLLTTLPVPDEVTTQLWDSNATNLAAGSFVNGFFLGTMTNPGVGVETLPAQLFVSLNLFPNPVGAEGRITIKVDVRETQQLKITLLDLSGREVRVLADQTVGKGRQFFALATNGLAPGMYFVQVYTEQGSVTEKLILTH